MVLINRQDAYVPALTSKYTPCKYCMDDSICFHMRMDYYYEGNVVQDLKQMCKFIRGCIKDEFEDMMKDKEFRKIFLQNEITQIMMVKNPSLKDVKIRITCYENMKVAGGIYINTFISKRIDASRYKVDIKLDRRVKHRREDFGIIERFLDESVIMKYC